GASGFIGRQVIAELVGRGHDVHVLGRSAEGMSAAAFWTCDLLVPGAAAPLLRKIGAEHLMHLAWNATPGAFWFAVDNIDWTAATLQLARAFADAGGKRSIFAGTCAEYDWSHDLLIEDETPLRPRTLYGRAKAASSELLLDWTARNGISIAWGRIFLPY